MIIDESERYGVIVWHPGRMSGDATIGHSRLTAVTLAGLVWAGDSIESIAEAYEVPTFSVELSCWWVALHHPNPCAWERRAGRKWRKWAQEWSYWAWHDRNTDSALYPDPPAAEAK